MKRKYNYFYLYKKFNLFIFFNFFIFIKIQKSYRYDIYMINNDIIYISLLIVIGKYIDPFLILTALISDYNFSCLRSSGSWYELWLSEAQGLESKSDLPGCREIVSVMLGKCCLQSLRLEGPSPVPQRVRGEQAECWQCGPPFKYSGRQLGFFSNFKRLAK